jgi:hypothetical protein
MVAAPGHQHHDRLLVALAQLGVGLLVVQPLAECQRLLELAERCFAVAQTHPADGSAIVGVGHPAAIVDVLRMGRGDLLQNLKRFHGGRQRRLGFSRKQQGIAEVSLTCAV